MTFSHKRKPAWEKELIQDGEKYGVPEGTTRHVIQVDIGGHPPFPNGSKQFSGHFGNLLFLAGFNFGGHFEGLNEGFLR